MKISVFIVGILSILSFGRLDLLPAANAATGTIIASGDSNILSTAPVILGVTPLGNTGNRNFMTNILQGGRTVKVLANNMLPSLDQNTLSFYNSLAGVSASAIVGAVTPASLVGTDLLISILPDDNFSQSEVAALTTFYLGGGTIFFLGENIISDFAPRNAAINSALTSMGITLRIVPDALDGIDTTGYPVASGNRIAVDLLTADVTSFVYGYTSRVSGGTPLFSTSQLQPFVSYQQYSSPIPEPISAILFLFGLLGILYSQRRTLLSAK